MTPTTARIPSYTVDYGSFSINEELEVYGSAEWVDEKSDEVTTHVDRVLIVRSGDERDAADPAFRHIGEAPEMHEALSLAFLADHWEERSRVCDVCDQRKPISETSHGFAGGTETTQCHGCIAKFAAENGYGAEVAG